MGELSDSTDLKYIEYAKALATLELIKKMEEQQLLTVENAYAEYCTGILSDKAYSPMKELAQRLNDKDWIKFVLFFEDSDGKLGWHIIASSKYICSFGGEDTVYISPRDGVDRVIPINPGQYLGYADLEMGDHCYV